MSADREAAPVALLPCPLCGKEPVGVEHPPHEHPLLASMGIDFPAHHGSYTIECPACNLGLIDDDETLAKLAWNRRAHPPQDKVTDERREPERCGECGSLRDCIHSPAAPVPVEGRGGEADPKTVCQVCKQPVRALYGFGPDGERESWYWRNVAPDAASGGVMLPIHDRCAAPTSQLHPDTVERCIRFVGSFMNPNGPHTKEYATACADIQDALRAMLSNEGREG